MSSWPRCAFLGALAAVLLALSAGCGHKLRGTLLPNERPTVTLTYAPASTSQPYSYAYQLYWSGFDPDGRVDHFLYCVDPPPGAGADTPWVATTENRKLFLFRSDDPDSLGTKARPGGYHVFVLKAVDGAGLCSSPAIEAFFSYTVAPKVMFVQPKPNPLNYPVLPPVTTFTFTGIDADGRTTRRPVRYKYKLFSEVSPEIDFKAVVTQADRLRQLFAPAFAGWDSIAGDTCRVQAPHLTPGRQYIFAVVAIDEAGAYSPVFSYDGNLLRFLCDFTGKQGPKISIWNAYFSQVYPGGGYNPDPASFVHIEVPGGQRIDFHWSAVAQNGADLRSFRWALDIERLDDETPRTDENTDWRHWSRAALGATGAIVGPFVGTGPDSLEEHRFYLEAEDSNGLKSLAVILLRVVRPSFARELLFVDDTRFSPDHSLRTWPDSTIAPAGLWPSAAELDTFLFARGGVRWRYYIPGTTKSPPGVFAGYSFDTVGTRFLNSGELPMSLLFGYRHVVWMCDAAAAYTQPPYYSSYPMPVLRWISGGNGTKSLAMYCASGGATWFLGGGIAYNTLLPFNVRTNDSPTITFSNAAGELLPGRLMYDAPHWRSEIGLKTGFGAVRNPALPGSRPGGPDYSLLPATLAVRSSKTDPVPPERTSASFYPTSYGAEVLTQPDNVLEDPTFSGDSAAFVPMLDTLYFATGGDAQGRPIMTYYHGGESGTTVFSGFPPWHFQRAQAILLADFVLQRIWGLSREPVPR